MTNIKKRPIFLVVSLLLVFTCIFTAVSIPASAATPDIMPCLNNALSAQSSVSISSTGVLTIKNKLQGIPGVTTKTVITTYVEKKVLGLFWKRVDIGQTNNQWVDTIYNDSYTSSHSVQLSSKGTYRITVKYEISGTGGAVDKIPYEITKTYG